MRYSAGVGLTWISPVGPLKFSYAMPVNKQPQDKVQKFQFTLGSIF
jgi:outer membrane protein insertion porin family